MIWVDREVGKIKKRNLPLEWVDDMKTPSGRIHVGALRGVVIHDLVYKVLLENKIKTKYTYVFDDHDPMDAIPSYLEAKKWQKYAGMQLYHIPSPKKGFSNFAKYYAQEFEQVFRSINCQPEIIWASHLYNSGKMNGVIRQVLDASDKIREIYYQVAKSTKPDDWHPFNVVCQKCRKVGTTYVYKWDGTKVHYRCQPRMVEWAQGCGHQGKVSPYNGNGKIPWKVDWAAKWKVVGVTIEGAGKDHMSAGGSHDIASAICRQVLNFPVPHPIAYEWFTVGGAKMSSSRGVGTSAKEVSEIMPPELTRFLLVRSPVTSAVDFDPYGDTIPDLFNDYDRCLTAYFDKIEGKIAKGKKGEVVQDFARIAQLSSVSPLPKKRPYLPRFRTVISLVNTKTDLLNFFADQKGTKLTAEEKKILAERVTYAKVYLEKYAGEEEKVEFQEEIPVDLKLSKRQVEFLIKLSDRLSIKLKSREEIQTAIFDLIKKGHFSPKEVFSAFYQVLIDKEFGPKAADLVLKFGLEKVRERLKEVTQR